MKKYLYIAFFCLFSLLFTLNVKGASSLPDTIVLGRDQTAIWYTDESGNQHDYYFKYTDVDGKTYLVFCLGSRTSSSAFTGRTYTKKAWDNDKYGAGVAYIIKNGVGADALKANWSSSDTRHRATQFAIWKYLNDVGVYPDTTPSYVISQMSTNCGDKSCSDFANDLVNGAKQYADLYEQKFMSSDTNREIFGFNIKALEFTQDGEYYVSNKIKAVDKYGYLDQSSIKVEIIKSPKNSVIEGNNNDGYTVKVPVASITREDSTVSIKISGTVTMSWAQMYYLSENNAQTLVPSLLLDKNLSAYKNFEYEFTSVEFSKQDATTGKELPGATLQILDSNKEEIKDKDGNVLYKWVSTDKPHTIINLPDGKYYLKEVIAPEGYELTETLIEFEVKDGKLTEPVVMKNEVTKVPVPDTGKNLFLPLIAIGMVFIFSGIGLFIYYKKENS